MSVVLDWCLEVYLTVSHQVLWWGKHLSSWYSFTKCLFVEKQVFQYHHCLGKQPFSKNTCCMEYKYSTLLQRIEAGTKLFFKYSCKQPQPSQSNTNSLKGLWSALGWCWLGHCIHAATHVLFAATGAHRPPSIPWLLLKLILSVITRSEVACKQLQKAKILSRRKHSVLWWWSSFS